MLLDHIIQNILQEGLSNSNVHVGFTIVQTQYNVYIAGDSEIDAQFYVRSGVLCREIFTRFTNSLIRLENDMSLCREGDLCHEDNSTNDVQVADLIQHILKEYYKIVIKVYIDAITITAWGYLKSSKQPFHLKIEGDYLDFDKPSEGVIECLRRCSENISENISEK